MNDGSTSQVYTDVLPFVPAARPGASARSIWKRMGCWAPGSVRHMLNQLFEIGEVDRELIGGRYLYWRVQ